MTNPKKNIIYVQFRFSLSLVRLNMSVIFVEPSGTQNEAQYPGTHGLTYWGLRGEKKKTAAAETERIQWNDIKGNVLVVINTYIYRLASMSFLAEWIVCFDYKTTINLGIFSKSLLLVHILWKRRDIICENTIKWLKNTFVSNIVFAFAFNWYEWGPTYIKMMFKYVFCVLDR